ncbi:hypothetical protein D3C85_1367010 [compost metagenome]
MNIAHFFRNHETKDIINIDDDYKSENQHRPGAKTISIGHLQECCRNEDNRGA